MRARRGPGMGSSTASSSDSLVDAPSLGQQLRIKNQLCLVKSPCGLLYASGRHSRAVPAFTCMPTNSREGLSVMRNSFLLFGNDGRGGFGGADVKKPTTTDTDR